MSFFHRIKSPYISQLNNKVSPAKVDVNINQRRVRAS